MSTEERIDDSGESSRLSADMVVHGSFDFLLQHDLRLDSFCQLEMVLARATI